MDSMAGGLSLVVLPWIVLDAGGSRSLAGAAFLIATIPYLALGLHAGELGDRSRRQPDDGVGGRLPGGRRARCCRLIVALGPAAGDLPIALIFAAGMGVTAGRVFVDAAAFGATARLVGDSALRRGPGEPLARLVARLPDRPGARRRADRARRRGRGAVGRGGGLRPRRGAPGVDPSRTSAPSTTTGPQRGRPLGPRGGRPRPFPPPAHVGQHGVEPDRERLLRADGGVPAN